MRDWRLPRVVAIATAAWLASGQPVSAAGSLTLPFNIPNPEVTSWMDHHYPNRQADGVMVRFDGATGYAYDGHRGTDYAVPANTPVVAADDGTVIYSEWSNDGGWGVVIDHATNRTAYFHNNRLFVYPGQHVSHGQLIALSGSTGNSTGPHVHFEVRDLQPAWHSIDPYGWTGAGSDPWSFDQGYLWASNPPRPYLLPLAFIGGAAWNHWYGIDGPPPRVSWQVTAGSRGLAGWAAQWDADPIAAGPRNHGPAGSAAVPGPGSHTLHLRVWEQGGGSADITYLYLYDVDPPTGALALQAAKSTASSVAWSATDALSGISQVTIESNDGRSGWRPWFTSQIDQPVAGLRQGATRFIGQPGANYQLRLTVRDAARNAAAPVVAQASIPAAAAAPPTANDAAVLGALPEQPGGSVARGGLQQEHPAPAGAIALGGDASVVGLGRTHVSAAGIPGSAASAVDIATSGAGSLELLADGSSWNTDGTAGPHFSVANPVRLLPAVATGDLVAVGANGGLSIVTEPAPTLAPERSQLNAVSLAAGVTVADAGLFPGTESGLMLDNTGALHAFDGSDAALAMAPASWTLPAAAAGLTLAGSAQAPAGILTDTAGDWQTFGSLLMLPGSVFGRPLYDPSTGLPIR
jgi:hypothetical protein